MSKSTLVLGTANFKTAPAKELVDYAISKGITAIDTADSYGTEKIVAEALNGRKVFISTKVGNPSALGSGLSREHIKKSCDASLLALNIDRIDLYYAHCWDKQIPIEESLHAFSELIKEGKVKEIGCSNFSQEQVDESFRISDKYGLPLFSYLQAPVNLIEQKFPTGIKIVAYSPLAGGVLTGKYLRGIPKGSRATQFSYEPRNAGYVPKLTGETAKIAQWVINEARVRNMTPSQFALHWVQANPQVDSVVIGASTLEQLKELL